MPVLVIGVLGLLAEGDVHAQGSFERLTSRPRQPVAGARALGAGAEVRTGPGDCQRATLPDGSILFINQHSSVRVEDDRRLTLSAGDIFLCLPAAKVDGMPFTVRTPKRELTADGGRFAVHCDHAGTGVVVTQGKVRVNGLDAPLGPGQELPPEGNKPRAAPRLSHTLSWTKDLLTTAESPLVPASQYAGGSLVVVDPNGQEAKLSLRKYHIDVHIEDGFARTTIDQTYFNHETTRLEGTFYFPLPPDASLSRLAMYVDGTLMEGGMAERDYARNVYESIVYRKRDPALLEWVDGSTFKMRIFPLEGRQEKRIILSYTQRLPVLYGRTSYRFPAANSTHQVGDWSFHARVRNGADLAWSCDSHTLTAARDKGDLLLDASMKDARADRDVSLALDERAGERAESVHFAVAEQDGANYLMLRFRPVLSGYGDPVERKDWVFLFESSGDRDPVLGRVQIDVIRSLLEWAQPDDTFMVLAAGTQVRRFAPEPRPVTPENVQAAVAFLENSPLIGALDLGRALTEAEPLLKAARNPYLVHVGSGIAAMGERRDDALARHVPDRARYVGVGVDKRWARSFMKLAAERSGGYFTQINPDEPVAWRAFDLAATLNTPRLLDVRVLDGEGRIDFLPWATSVAQGEEICAVARYEGQPLPHRVAVRAVLNGRPWVQLLDVQNVVEKADYLPRTWAKLETERLLAEDPVKHKDRIVALSKAMYVMTPFTSLLVLENEDMYQEYKVDRGRKDHWAMYPCPAKIPVVREPLPGQAADADGPIKGVKPSALEVLRTVEVRVPPRLLRLPGHHERDDSPWHTGWQEVLALAGFVEEEQELSKRKVNDRTLGVGRGPGSSTPTRAADLAIQTHGSFGMPIPPFGGFPAMSEKRKVVFDAAPQLSHSLLPMDNNLKGKELQVVGKRILPAREAHLLDDLDEPELHDFLGPRRRDVGNDVHPVLASKTISWSDRNEELLSKLRETIKHQTIVMRGFLDTEAVAEWVAMPERNPGLRYRRPTYSGDVRLFHDLVSYAPGMNTSRADLESMLEGEALGAEAPGGEIEQAARALIDKARTAGWQQWTPEGSAEKLTVTFDGSGRFAWERTLPIGLRERVVCDGKTLLHLYPDLGIGARRAVSRFHREELAALVPWVLPPAEDLARGADVRRVGERTVAIIPHGADFKPTPPGIFGPPKPINWEQEHLLFAEDGQLVERQVLEMPANKVLLRQTYSGNGTVKILDGAGKELGVLKGKRSATGPANLEPDPKDLVILALPYRTPDQVRKALKIENKSLDNLRFEEGLALFAAYFARRDGSEALAVFRQTFSNHHQRQLGFYVLLAACGENLDAEHVNVLAEHLNEPLAQYLALHSSPVLRRHASQWAVGTSQWSEGFLQRLAVLHALYQRWENARPGGTDAQRKAELERALDYVRQNKGTPFGWALLSLLQDRAGEEPAFHQALTDAWLLFEDVSGLSYAARYEHARSLWESGKRDQARQRFRELYEKTLAEDSLPPLDADFRRALLGDADHEDDWSALLRRTADQLIEKKNHAAVLALARQAWELGDEALGNHLLALAVEHPARQEERLPMKLAGLKFLWQTAQLERADQVLQGLLTDKQLEKKAALWRLGAQLAQRRDMPARELACLERALELEYQHLPEVIDLQAVRRDYGKLLERYQNLADALVTLQSAPPAGFARRVVSAADRWRSLDSDAEEPCRAAAHILQTLGDRELAWDYLTTPVGLRPNEAKPWTNLAEALVRRGDLDLADRAFAAAFEAEPTNAQVLWDRAQNLHQAGKRVEAQTLYRQLAEGEWQPRFNWLKVQARVYINER
jgi:predicted Zn-dependent protease